jgi:hypothetical protein
LEVEIDGENESRIDNIVEIWQNNLILSLVFDKVVLIDLRIGAKRG